MASLKEELGTGARHRRRHRKRARGDVEKRALAIITELQAGFEVVRLDRSEQG
ncbi:MAG: hypothetical protein JO162_07225 [Alphaproteobacteria bacterium]|nr:hypothetical protein [Alphaproteobacteria bacterium]